MFIAVKEEEAAIIIAPITPDEIAHCIDETISHGIFERDLHDLFHFTTNVKMFIKSIHIFMNKLDNQELLTDKKNMVCVQLLVIEKLLNFLSSDNIYHISNQLCSRFRKVSSILKS